jgi:Zn-dependent protease
MYSQPSTSMNLSFRLGKIPVHIQPAFFVVSAFLGSSTGGLAGTAAWIAVVFASVLVHELGHATACLAFGVPPRIQLHTMGGTTSWEAARPLSRPQRVIISLAGPFAGFVLWGLTWACGAALPPLQSGFVYGALRYVNLWWGLVNLVPLLPLDGGNVMVQLLDGLTSGRGERPARVVSIAVSAGAIALALATRYYWGAMLALLFASDNWRALQSLRARERSPTPHPDGTRG